MCGISMSFPWACEKVKECKFGENVKRTKSQRAVFYFHILSFLIAFSTKFPAFSGNISKSSRSQKQVLGTPGCQLQPHASFLACFGGTPLSLCPSPSWHHDFCTKIQRPSLMSFKWWRYWRRYLRLKGCVLGSFSGSFWWRETSFLGPLSGFPHQFVFSVLQTLHFEFSSPLSLGTVTQAGWESVVPNSVGSRANYENKWLECFW